MEQLILFVAKLLETKDGISVLCKKSLLLQVEK